MTVIRDDFQRKDPLSKKFRKFYKQSQKLPKIKINSKTIVFHKKNKKPTV